MDNVPEVIVDDVLEVKAALGGNVEAAEAFQRVISYYASLRHLDDERRRAIEQNLARYVNEQLEKAMVPVQTAVQNMWNHSELLATEKTVQGAGKAIAGAVVESLKQVQDQLTLMSSRTEGVAYALDEIEERVKDIGGDISIKVTQKPRKKAKPVTILGRMMGKSDDKEEPKE
jgi:hypothetical protein